MTDVVVAQRMWQRRDTAANWIAANPVLNAGEIGVQLPVAPSKLCRFKIGDGVTAWVSLPYQGTAGVVALTDAASVLVDASASDSFRVTLGGNRALANPTNLISGQVLNIRILQDGTGGRLLTFGSMYKFPNGAVPTLSTAANARDFMSCQYDDTNGTLYCVMSKAFG